MDIRTLNTQTTGVPHTRLEKSEKQISNSRTRTYFSIHKSVTRALC